MTARDLHGGAGRAIDACHRAGLPVLNEDDCTCGLRGRLVVLATGDGLRILWPCYRQCPLHDPTDREGSPPTGRPRRGVSRSQATQPARAEQQVGVR